MNDVDRQQIMDPMDVLLAAKGLAEDEAATPPELPDFPERPVITNPEEVREAFWSILALPLRHRAIRWMDNNGFLAELFPAFAGNGSRRKRRIDAVESVHLEAWAEGMDPAVLKAICDVHDIVVDGRLNRWALTALATLFAGGDIEDPRAWSSFVRRDLYDIGATEGEIVWITGITRNFNTHLLYLRGVDVKVDLRPEPTVAALSTIHATEADQLPEAVQRANEGLRDIINPLDQIPEEDD